MTETAITKASATEPDHEFYAEVERATNIFNEREYSAAIEVCEKAIERWPGRAEMYFILGVISYEMGNQGRAITLIEMAHAIDPDCRDYAEALATIHTRVGNLTDGLYYAKLTVALEPHPHFRPLVPAPLSDYFGALKNAQPSVHYLTGARLFNQRRFAEAVDALRAELEINRSHMECSRLLGRSLHMTGDYGRAVDALHAAVHLAPQDPLTQAYLGDSLLRLGRFSEAFASHERARQLAPGEAAIHAATMSGLAYQPSDEAWAHYRKRAAHWARRAVKARAPGSGIDKAMLDQRKIRVGYLSHALFEGPEMSFIEALLRNHDRSQFEVFCYPHFVTKDSVSTALESQVDRWRNIYDIDPVTASYMLQGDGLDILVDLSGHADGERLVLLGQRPAPVQVAWLGHPEAAASPGIDYVLSDAITARHDRKMCLKGQETVVLEGGLIAVRPFSHYPAVSDSPAGATRAVTFGGVCDLARLGPDVAALWTDVLMAVPGSRLVLGYVNSIPQAVRNHAIELFAHYGVTDRVQFQERTPGADSGPWSNLEFFSLIDVMLDTTPVSGTIETCQALWMGVPVISLVARRRAGLMGASILAAAGKPEWVANTRRRFVRIAAALAKEPAQLAELRRTLRGEVETSALFDVRAFAKGVENAYRSILQK